MSDCDRSKRNHTITLRCVNAVTIDFVSVSFFVWFHVHSDLFQRSASIHRSPDYTADAQGDPGHHITTSYRSPGSKSVGVSYCNLSILTCLGNWNRKYPNNVKAFFTKEAGFRRLDSGLDLWKGFYQCVPRDDCTIYILIRTQERSSSAQTTSYQCGCGH